MGPSKSHNLGWICSQTNPLSEFSYLNPGAFIQCKPPDIFLFGHRLSAPFFFCKDSLTVGEQQNRASTVAVYLKGHFIAGSFNSATLHLMSSYTCRDSIGFSHLQSLKTAGIF